MDNQASFSVHRFGQAERRMPILYSNVRSCPSFYLLCEDNWPSLGRTNQRKGREPIMSVRVCSCRSQTPLRILRVSVTCVYHPFFSKVLLQSGSLPFVCYFSSLFSSCGFFAVFCITNFNPSSSLKPIPTRSSARVRFKVSRFKHKRVFIVDLAR
jgi:hypothetical protein